MPFSEHSTSACRRRARVSSFFALITQKLAVRRYEGVCAWKLALKFVAVGFLENEAQK